LEQKQFWEALARCLGKLPPKMAQAFSLREVDELTSEEVCAALHITSSNLWVLLHRARKQLRGCLEKSHFSDAPQFEEA
jgi:RNA polymerase sigma-70 factor (ECF subfamily)